MNGHISKLTHLGYDIIRAWIRLGNKFKALVIYVTHVVVEKPCRKAESGSREQLLLLLLIVEQRHFTKSAANIPYTLLLHFAQK